MDCYSLLYFPIVLERGQKPLLGTSLTINTLKERPCISILLSKYGAKNRDFQEKDKGNHVHLLRTWKEILRRQAVYSFKANGIWNKVGEY